MICLIVLAATGFALPSSVLAVPLAMTTVIGYCEVGNEIVQKTSANKLVEQDFACDLELSTSKGLYQANGHAKAGFGPGFPLIGNVDVLAVAGAPDDPRTVEASFIASLRYFFEIEPIVTGIPGGVPQLPTFFMARGEGRMSPEGGRPGDNASAEGSVMLKGPNQNLVSWRFEDNGGFDETIRLNLFPTRTYEVDLVAGCTVMAGSMSTCQVVVDPFIGFDQATFDQIMGQSTFPLDEYYRFVFSPNIPLQPPPHGAPEPTSLGLLGLGLAGLVAMRRKKLAA